MNRRHKFRVRACASRRACMHTYIHTYIHTYAHAIHIMMDQSQTQISCAGMCEQEARKRRIPHFGARGKYIKRTYIHTYKVYYRLAEPSIHTCTHTYIKAYTLAVSTSSVCVCVCMCVHMCVHMCVCMCEQEAKQKAHTTLCSSR